jgi:hypothetical protein
VLIAGLGHLMAALIEEGLLYSCLTFLINLNSNRLFF